LIIFTWLKAIFNPTIEFPDLDLPSDKRTTVQQYIDFMEYMDYYHQVGGGGLKKDEEEDA
jgi:hypothetical protein